MRSRWLNVISELRAKTVTLSGPRTAIVVVEIYTHQRVAWIYESWRSFDWVKLFRYWASNNMRERLRSSLHRECSYFDTVWTITPSRHSMKHHIVWHMVKKRMSQPWTSMSSIFSAFRVWEITHLVICNDEGWKIASMPWSQIVGSMYVHVQKG